MTKYSYAEIWSCPYTFKGEKRLNIVKREGNNFVDLEFNYSYQIIFENSSFIHLYSSDGGTFFAQSLNKENKMFSMIALEPGYDSALISGDCKIFN